MEILYCLIGIAFGFTSVFFYVLGLSHGRKVEKGLRVKLEPIRAVINAVEDIRTDKEEKEKAEKATASIMQLLNYNGERKVKK